MNDPMVLLGRLAEVHGQLEDVAWNTQNKTLMSISDRAEELRLELTEAVQELERKVRENAKP